MEKPEFEGAVPRDLPDVIHMRVLTHMGASVIVDTGEDRDNPDSTAFYHPENDTVLFEDPGVALMAAEVVLTALGYQLDYGKIYSEMGFLSGTFTKK